MGDVVNLKLAQLSENRELIVDCCRFQEGILSEANMRRKYGFAESVWENLAENTKLLSEVEEEKLRRMRSGVAKREKSQLHVLRAPDVAAKIMLDENANSRHRLDACKILDDFSETGPGSAAAGTIFEIRIDLGGGVVEHYRKPVKIDANGTDTDSTVIEHNNKPQLVAITSKPAAATNKTPEEIALDSLMLLGD